MRIKAEMRWFYPIDWPQISRQVRFERARGVCQDCGRPHGQSVRCLSDGRWFDVDRHIWRSDRGKPAAWPNIEEAIRIRQTRIVLAAAHLDHDPGNNRPRNLRSLCQRCHLIHDRPHHLARRRRRQAAAVIDASPTCLGARFRHQPYPGDAYPGAV